MGRQPVWRKISFHPRREVAGKGRLRRRAGSKEPVHARFPQQGVEISPPRQLRRRRRRLLLLPRRGWGQRRLLLTMMLLAVLQLRVPLWLILRRGDDLSCQFWTPSQSLLKHAVAVQVAR